MADVAVTDSASPGGMNRKPPSLNTSFALGGHVRRQSTISSGSSDDDEACSPVLSALDSSAALILVHDQDEPTSPLDFDDDEDANNGDDQDIVSPMFEVRKSTVFPPLPPSLVFLFLLAPFLRLGALELPNCQIPLKYGLPALLLSALATAFARQIWYMLARYLRKADMTDIILDTFAKGRGKDMRRALMRGVVRIGSSTITMGVSVTYLRYSIYILLPLLGKKHPVISYFILAPFIGIIIGYLSYARSLGSRRILYATWLSLLTYICWLGCTIYAHCNGLLAKESGWLGSASIHQSLITSAFSFCSSSTLPLYASLKITSNPLSTGKSPRSRSFRVLSFLSIVTAVLLLLPSVILAAFPNQTAVSSHPWQVAPPIENITTVPSILVSTSPVVGNATSIPLLNSIPSLSPPLPPKIVLPRVHIQTVRHVLAAVTLILGTPSIIITIPPLAMPIRSAKFNVSRMSTILLVVFFALIPPSVYSTSETGDSKSYIRSSMFFAPLTVLMLLMSFIGTYFLPALLHGLQHFVKRPLAIVVPPRTPLLQTESAGGDFSSRQSNPRAIYDELLLRKERALQQKQSRKRIIWDIGVWVLLGASGTGVVFTVVAFIKSW
ncbi:hypothetical protein JR316_0002358 [Psilocybe cubensis]|uniref:Uncharacterized protein n=2 Tax=Psilocybe cubensis TaxID=181762 RepID=A0A8H7Y336_PSICU|nr:hypothetical protein JR316_0002358 [Psilocybe cubensis]KAH9485450.1 hypothetical protein JR316_0002358 [Psilocybe cubensis]